MTDITRLLAEYIAEHQAGGDADPLAYLRRVDAETERVRLAEEIDRYLLAAPRRPFDPSTWAESSSVQTVDALDRALSGQAGLWPALLPRLRARAGMKRTVLVERLASALGVSDKSEKVAAYYHAMEQGLLDSRGVSDTVLRALGNIVGESLESLRTAGRTAAEPRLPAPAGSAAFARRAARPPEEASASEAAPDAGTWDEVDQLFTGREGR